MAFQIITPTKTRGTTKKAKVTIQPSGLVSLNKKSVELVAGKGKFVEVYHDPDTNRLGFKFVEKQSEATLKLGKSGAGFSGKSALQGKADFTKIHVYEAEIAEKMLVIDLGKGVEMAKRKRKATTEGSEAHG